MLNVVPLKTCKWNEYSGEKKKLRGSFPTEHFTIFQIRNLSMAGSELHSYQRYSCFEALNLWKVPSGRGVSFSSGSARRSEKWRLGIRLINKDKPESGGILAKKIPDTTLTAASAFARRCFFPQMSHNSSCFPNKYLFLLPQSDSYTRPNVLETK